MCLSVNFYIINWPFVSACVRQAWCPYFPWLATILSSFRRFSFGRETVNGFWKRPSATTARIDGRRCRSPLSRTSGVPAAVLDTPRTIDQDRRPMEPHTTTTMLICVFFLVLLSELRRRVQPSLRQRHRYVLRCPWWHVDHDVDNEDGIEDRIG